MLSCTLSIHRAPKKASTANIRQTAPLRGPLTPLAPGRANAEKILVLKEMEERYSALPKASIHAKHKLRMIRTAMRLLEVAR